MIRAAIYARKSTDDSNEEESKSVARQIEGARTFISSRKWTLDETQVGTKQVRKPDGSLTDKPISRHIYEDDGVSGVLFANRAEFQRMMRDARAHAFSHIVFFDLDRFGRHAHKTMVALNELAKLRVKVWDYSTGQSIDLDSFEGRVTTNLKAEFAEEFRAKIRKHTTRAMRKKAELGYVTGCKVFGYDHERIGDGHAEWKINPTQAAVVRDIYTRFAEGFGAKAIVASLNAANVPTPRAQQGRPAGWSVSTVRAVLERPMYRGDIVYGRMKNAYDLELSDASLESGRESGQVKQPENTWIRVHREELRIIDAELAERCDNRRLDRKTRYHASVAKGGKVPERAHGKYLLSGGMLLCPDCGGHFEMVKSPWKPGGQYLCSTRRRKPGICSNALALPMAETDEIVLSIVEGRALGRTFIEELLSLVDRGEVDHSVRLTADKDRIQKEVDNLVASIAAGVPADTVAPAIKIRQTEVAKVDAELSRPRTVAPNIEKLREALTLRAAEWSSQLRAEPEVARLILRRLVGPLTLHNPTKVSAEWIAWEASLTSGLLDGLNVLVASPTGFEPVF